MCAALSMAAASAYAETPMAYIEGDVSPEIRELLGQVIGQTDAPPRSLAQARRRAEKAAEQARSVMRSRGFYGAEITARIDEFVPQGDETKRRPPKPVLLINSGPQFRFSNISVNFDDKTPDNAAQASKEIAISAGSPAHAAAVVAAELNAVNYLKAHGYPEAEILPRKAVVDHDKTSLDVDFNFKAGDKTYFGVIEQTGTARTVKSWSQMVAPFKPGDVFDDTLLNQLSSRIIATGVFDSATAILDDEKISNADGSVTRNVLLNIEQGAMNTISGEIGYSTSDGSGIDLTYERRNFVGYAQTLTLSTTLKTNQIRLGADYSIPYFFRQDRALDIGAEIAREDTDAFTGSRVGTNALITQKISNRLKVGLGVGVEASEYKENGLDVTSYLFEGLGRATYDTRDSVLDPEKGFLVEASATPTYNFGNQDGLFTVLSTGASHYQRLSDTLVLAGRVKAGVIFGADQTSVPLNKRFYGGGGGSVRGFGYQTISPISSTGQYIGGRSISEASAELRYHGEGPFGAALFVDAGSVSLSDLPDLSDIRYGAGVGLRYYTSFAPLRFDIAVPLNKRANDNAVQIYISIGQAF